MSKLDLSTNLDRLLRARSRGEFIDAYRAHAAIVDAGQDAIPAIRRKILDIDWSQLGREKVGILTCLFLPLHDIDEDMSRAISAEVVAKGCHLAFQARLESLMKFTVTDFNRLEYGSLGIFIAKSIGKPTRVATALTRWLQNAPPEDLDGISRLYVFRNRKANEWGFYVHIFSKIGVVWRRLRLATEYTLYHEIGHHRHGLMLDNTRQERESLADAYASELFSRVHPWLCRGIVGRGGGRKVARQTQ